MWRWEANQELDLILAVVVAQYSGLINSNSNEFHCLFCSGKSDGESSRNFLQQPVSLSIIPPFVI